AQTLRSHRKQCGTRYYSRHLTTRHCEFRFLVRRGGWQSHILFYFGSQQGRPGPAPERKELRWLHHSLWSLPRRFAPRNDPLINVIPAKAGNQC
ncbi:MAG: hypothetical protein SGI97_08355, partial [candidate division Zixibacteria bacterium]|nr:hypothetical protein [candidate division Zixibacteria bacterium]